MLYKARIGPNYLFFVFTLLLGSWVVAQTGHKLVNENTLQQITQTFGEKGRALFESWVELVISQKDSEVIKSDQEKLEHINRFFNEHIRFRSDETHWQKEDYWATPMESLVTSGGDCEDYVIAKYFSLIQAGVDQEKLRITYVKAIRLNQAHMVLAYYPEPKSEPLILDNINPNILKASKRRDLVPVYSFNGLGMWLERQQGSIRVGNANRLNMWVDVLLRMQEQGLGPWSQIPSATHHQ